MRNESDELTFDVNDDQNSVHLIIPIEFDIVRSVSHILLISVGVPLNLFVAVVILAFKRLHNKPRNVFWLGVTVSNILTLITILIEYLAFQLQNNFICAVFVSITGVAYTCLLFNLLLALTDRYVAIVYPLWHHRRVTVRWAIFSQLGGLCFFTVVIKFPFISRLVPLSCSIIPVHSKIIAVTNAVLFLLCIIAQIVVYRKTRQYFSKQRNGQVSISFITTQGRQRQENVTNSTDENRVQLPAEDAVVITYSSTSDRHGPSLRHHHGNNRRMEVEATWSLLTGVFSLTLFTFPTLLTGFIFWGCRAIYGEDQCSNISSITFYTREFLLGHLDYTPSKYIMRSGEFKSTIREKMSSNQSRHRTTTHRPPLRNNYCWV